MKLTPQQQSCVARKQWQHLSAMLGMSEEKVRALYGGEGGSSVKKRKLGCTPETFILRLNDRVKNAGTTVRNLCHAFALDEQTCRRILHGKQSLPEDTLIDIDEWLKRFERDIELRSRKAPNSMAEEIKEQNTKIRKLFSIGLKHAEIAAAMKMPVKRVGGRIQSMRKRGEL